MKFKFFLTAFFSILLLGTAANMAQEQTACFVDKNNVAIKGYDVVSYFNSEKPLKGSEKYKVTFDNATFYFANKYNKNLFEKNPAKYLPQYGGYCAFGMGAKNAKVPSNPETYEIVDGKLFLFFNDNYKGKKMNTKIMWDKAPEKFHKMADANWKKQMQKKQ